MSAAVWTPGLGFTWAEGREQAVYVRRVESAEDPSVETTQKLPATLGTPASISPDGHLLAAWVGSRRFPANDGQTEVYDVDSGERIGAIPCQPVAIGWNRESTRLVLYGPAVDHSSRTGALWVWHRAERRWDVRALPFWGAVLDVAAGQGDAFACLVAEVPDAPTAWGGPGDDPSLAKPQVRLVGGSLSGTRAVDGISAIPERGSTGWESQFMGVWSGGWNVKGRLFVDAAATRLCALTELSLQGPPWTKAQQCDVFAFPGPFPASTSHEYDHRALRWTAKGLLRTDDGDLFSPDTGAWLGRERSTYWQDRRGHIKILERDGRLFAAVNGRPEQKLALGGGTDSLKAGDWAINDSGDLLAVSYTMVGDDGRPYGWGTPAAAILRTSDWSVLVDKEVGPEGSLRNYTPGLEWTASGDWVGVRFGYSGRSGPRDRSLLLRASAAATIYTRPDLGSRRGETSADGEYILRADRDSGTVEIAGPAIGDGAWARVRASAGLWSPKGCLLAVVDRSASTVGIWRPDRQEFLVPPIERSGSACWVRGKNLLLVEGDLGSIIIDPTTATRTRVGLPQEADRARMPVITDWTRDGSLLAMPMGSGEVKVWDRGSDSVVLTASGDYRSFEWMPGGASLVGYAPDRFQVWAVPSGSTRGQLPGTFVSVSPGGSHMLSERGGTAFVHDRYGIESCAFGPFVRSTDSICVGPSRRRLVSASRDGSLRVQPALSGPTSAWGCKRYDRVIGLSRAGDVVRALVEVDGRQEIVSVGGGSPPASVIGVRGQLPLVAWRAHENGDFGAVLQSGDVCLIDAGSGDCRGLVGGALEVPEVQEPRSLVLGAGSASGSLLTHVTGTRTVVHADLLRSEMVKWRAGSAETPIRALAISGDAGIAAIGLADGRIEARDARSGDLLAVVSVPEGPVRAVALSRDGGRLFAAGDAPAVHVFDPFVAEPITAIPTDANVTALSIDDGMALAVGCEGGSTVLLASGIEARRVTDYSPRQ